ncbi:AVN_HP_G0120080.mRNA.1.CDS.1 [Saccharomyces cerevisiae]|nr:AVN_HP_G0120080.mRNA.1.CDS.1 [Saccharomyces cerevisiae]CAI6997169.1 AVN_HP_G0120080.mRNA.1.CDS.1 [Saccharomyces cerevisiae]
MKTSVPVKKALKCSFTDPETVIVPTVKAPASHPPGLPWSLGVFICIKCTGIHRSLGTISESESVDLDTWKEEHLR